MSDEVVGRVRYALDKQRSWRGTEWQDAPRASLPTADLRTLLARLDAAERELDAANAHIALLEGEGHTGCDERIYQLESDLATLRERLAGEVGVQMAKVPRFRMVRQVKTATGYSVQMTHHDERRHRNEPKAVYWPDVQAAIDRAVAVIRGEGT